MARQRLGKAERAIVRDYHQKRRDQVRAIVVENLSKPVERVYPIRTSSVYGASPKILIGPDRGTYDPMFSTDRDTGRGLPKVKPKAK
jgi:hypothetical protein